MKTKNNGFTSTAKAAAVSAELAAELGVTAVFFALVLPKGLWGWIAPKLPGEAIPTGYIIKKLKND